MNRRAQAQRKFAQVTTTGAATSPAGGGGTPVRAVASVSAAGSVGPRTTPARTTNDAAIIPMNVHQLMDLISTQRLLQEPVAKARKLKVPSPIRTVAGGIIKKKQQLKLKPDNVQSRRLTRSKASGIRSLRTRNISTPTPKTPTTKPPVLVKTPPAKTPTPVTPSSSVTKHEVLAEEPGRILRTRKFKNTITPTKRPAVTLNKKIINFRPMKRAKTTETSVNVSDYSTEDETPLKLLPRRTSEAIADTVTSEKDAAVSSEELNVDSVDDMSSNVIGEPKAKMEKEMGPLQQELELFKLDRCDFVYNKNNFPDPVQVKPKEEVNTEPPSKTLEEIKNEVYDFASECENDPPPIIGFQTKRRSLSVVKSDTTQCVYVDEKKYVIEEKCVKVAGRGKELHCKLVLPKINLTGLKLASASGDFCVVDNLAHVTSTVKDTTKAIIIKPATDSLTAEPIANMTRTKKGTSDVTQPAVHANYTAETRAVNTIKDSASASCSYYEYATTRDSEPATSTQASKSFPKPHQPSCSVEAPIFKPSEAEFQDPLHYIERISPIASKYGLCKIIPPTYNKQSASASKLTFFLPDEIKFTAYNQYLNRMYQRWGPATREICAMKKYLATQGVSFDRAPLIDGVEVDLPALFLSVQNHGGLNEVMDKNKWRLIAEDLKLANVNKRLCTKLDRIYVKYLLPYDTMSQIDRQKVFDSVDKMWTRKYQVMLARAKCPMRRQRRLLRASTSSCTSSDDETERVLTDSEECVTGGRSMTLAYFQNVSSVVKQMYFPEDAEPSPAMVENEYWQHVLLRSQHVCVYAAAVDSGEAGLGFPKPKSGRDEPPWNLKVLSGSADSVLRSLGPVLGLTVPTVHLGMVFSTSCWNRDPHGLPWIEYHHAGAPKIWYGIPDSQSCNFRNAVDKLAPSFCLKKTIWLPSDVMMLPPNLLNENGVSVSRTVQEPGELVVVFPKAYTSSICTGYSVSESVYFGPKDWLSTVLYDFHDVQESCEPTMFPLEQLLLSIAGDARVAPSVLLQAYSTLKIMLDEERRNRKIILDHHCVKMVNKAPIKTKRNATLAEECDVCRTSLYLSKVTGVAGMGSQVCCKHAVEMLNQRVTRQKTDIRDVELVCHHSTAELDQALEQIEARIFPTSE